MRLSSDVTIRDLLADVSRQIDASLDQFTQFPEGCPPRLVEAIRYSLLAPGKRLRPALVLWSAETCGCEAGQAIPAACAVEMVHCYSLIHDDLPAMDNDDLRRGKASCHKAFDEATAILAGDALLALAFETIAAHVRPPSVAAACCATLASAAGTTGLVGGQADDLDGHGLMSDVTRLESIHLRKTGAIFRASLRLGALVAQADARHTQALDEYGRRLGLAFQISDDILDIKGHEKSIGKRVNKDLSQGKLTFPGLLGMDESMRRARVLVDQACEAISGFGPQAAKLDALARFVLERNH
jgi:geranylgeranyl diphosphate synthase, type II